MENFFYGQHIIDHRSRKFKLTELYWSVGKFDDRSPYHTIEFNNGCLSHIQGNFEDCRLSKIGFVGEDGNLTVLTIEQARHYVAQRYLKFE